MNFLMLKTKVAVAADAQTAFWTLNFLNNKRKSGIIDIKKLTMLFDIQKCCHLSLSFVFLHLKNLCLIRRTEYF